jgi:hypothetical protein
MKGFVPCEHTENAIIILFVHFCADRNEAKSGFWEREKPTLRVAWQFAVGQLSDFSLCENRKLRPSNKVSAHPSFRRRRKTRRGGAVSFWREFSY